VRASIVKKKQKVASFSRIVGQAFEIQIFLAAVNTLLTALGMVALKLPAVGFLSAVVFACSFIPVAGPPSASAPLQPESRASCWCMERMGRVMPAIRSSPVEQTTVELKQEKCLKSAAEGDRDPDVVNHARSWGDKRPSDPFAQGFLTDLFSKKTSAPSLQMLALTSFHSHVDITTIFLKYLKPSENLTSKPFVFFSFSLICFLCVCVACVSGIAMSTLPMCLVALSEFGVVKALQVVASPPPSLLLEMTWSAS
jgi:hypothetical protein